MRVCVGHAKPYSLLNTGTLCNNAKAHISATCMRTKMHVISSSKYIVHVHIYIYVYIHMHVLVDNNYGTEAQSC